MSKRDLSRDHLYEGVKLIVESDANHIHLTQQKLYTLFSLAFNYMLYRSDKSPGHYIIRVENSYLLEKLIKKAKDDTSRKFLQKLALPRRFKYGRSVFHLDFFNFATWANTSDLPKEKIQGAIIIKNANKSPIGHDFIEEDEQYRATLSALPKDYYVSSLTEFVPKTITIAFEEDYADLKKIQFPFIKEEQSDKVTTGVNIASDINLDEL